jgi:N-methylhydantoinase B/oxoprolinase/acetone carboxylase alpha subunit
MTATLPELAVFFGAGGEIAPGGVDLVAYAANKRWQKEVGGIALGGIPIATDDRSKLMIMGARLAAQSDPEWSTIWIGADGVAYPINGAMIVMISDAVAEHVNACFATFATVKSAIEAETVTTTAEIDAAFAL